MKIALVDGYNLAFRAFYGMPDLTRKDGFPTGALHGWVRSLWWVDDRLAPDRLVVFFDLGGAARQTALHADYKANRKETPPALEQQIPAIKQWTRAMGYTGVERDGVEADDLIASVAVRRAEAGDTVTVYRLVARACNQPPCNGGVPAPGYVERQIEITRIRR